MIQCGGMVRRQSARWCGGRKRWIPMLLTAAFFSAPATADAGTRAAPFQARLRLVMERHVLPPSETAALQPAPREAERVRVLLPAERARAFAAVCEQAERAAVPLNRVRARVLTETLAINTAFFPNALAARDARAASGAVYRRYGDTGYQFQPLASFAS